MPAKSNEFYERVVFASYSRYAKDVLSLKDIVEDAKLILSAEEIKEGLALAIDSLVAKGRLQLVDAEKNLYRYNFF